MKNTSCLLLILFSVFSFAQKDFQPGGSTAIETVDGDLDGDQIPEKVIIYNTKDTTEYGNIHEIQILKKVNEKWELLEKSRNAILEGYKNDVNKPYQGTIIRNGILIIEHYGGNSWKRSVIDKYRYSDRRFKLIGVTSGYGRTGVYSRFDFNLLTGKIIYRKEVNKGLYHNLGKPEKEIFIKKGLIITLKDRKKDQLDITLPKTKAVLTL